MGSGVGQEVEKRRNLKEKTGEDLGEKLGEGRKIILIKNGVRWKTWQKWKKDTSVVAFGIAELEVIDVEW